MIYQNQMVISYLMSGKTLTPLEALNMFGCLRLAARVYELRSDGWPILKEMKRHPINEHIYFAEYYLNPDKSQWPTTSDAL